MSLEENKTLIRRYTEEVITHHNYDALDEFCVPDVVWHNRPPGVAGRLEGSESLFQGQQRRHLRRREHDP